MIRNILVPLDGSTFGEQALPQALELAARNPGSTLHLVHVLVRPEPIVEATGAGAIEASWDESWRGEAREYLERVAAAQVAAQGHPVVLRVLHGFIGEVLSTYAEEHAIDMIVMTTHGRGGVSRVWLGSVADQIVRQLSIPVLLLRPTAAGPMPVVAPRQVLVPIDGEFSEAALEPALDLVGPDGAITLLHVLAPTYVIGAPYLASGMMMDREIQEAQEQRGDAYLRQVAARLAGRVAHVNRIVRTHANAATVIVDVAATAGADAVVIATHGRRNFARWALGSVADKVIRSCEVPVLVVRPGREVRGLEERRTAVAAH
jgi:nucleotide-binding universal stress UspA family protein